MTLYMKSHHLRYITMASTKSILVFLTLLFAVVAHVSSDDTKKQEILDPSKSKCFFKVITRSQRVFGTICVSTDK